ncbi:O-antigen ligase family protein [Gaoshiqia sediminis]|uniref:O-antigen ligase family protein n=1 Tax=Gaoshiqia sediminis TaxID=2986998 RepID=A0AA41Y9E9_9BACT|nr:O-antigen ligase family protein [Gaoshiqia sediminis]MCW0481660.1 O-antigen ligase family protein [Gaoshiqia sediminis]
MRWLQQFALFIFFFSMNFEVWDPFQTGGFFSISRLTGIIYFVVSVPSMVRYRTGSEVRPVLNAILLFFCLLLFMNAIHAESVNDHILDNTILQNIVLFWVLVNHERTNQLVLEKGLLFFALGSTALALLFYQGIGIEYTDGRVSIFGDNENVIGQRMCISIIIVLMTVVQNRLQLGKFRYLLLFTIPVMLGLLVATGSRLAIVSFVIVFVAGLVLLKTKAYSAKMTVFVVGGILLLLIGYYSMQNEILRTRLLMSLHEGDLSNRDAIWEHLIPLIEENLLFGVGQSGYDAFCLATFGRDMSPHSVVMELLCFTGIAGLVIYLSFIYLIFWRSYLSYKQSGILLPILLIIIVVGMLLGSHILELKLGWSILAYITCGTLSACRADEPDILHSSTTYPTVIAE